MSLTATQREELVWLASGRGRALSMPGIVFFTALYRRYGTATAREVTEIIGRETQDGGWPEERYFGGFIGASSTRGFRSEVSDPCPTNPQTGHFFSFVMWALNGISEVEYAAAFGHEMIADWNGGVAQSAMAYTAPTAFWAFRAIVEMQPLDGDSRINYGHWDRLMNRFGIADAIGEPTAIRDGERYYTGNSIQDMRCTIAGFYYGRLIANGCFRNAEHAAQWLDNNIVAADGRGAVLGIEWREHSTEFMARRPWDTDHSPYRVSTLTTRR
jgi:hypothetical protein